MTESSSSEAKVGRVPSPRWRLAPTVLTELTEDEHPKPGGNFSLPGRADPLELIVHALNETGADAVGSVIQVSEDDR
jgi:hypothetical protein